MSSATVAASLSAVFAELVDGPPGTECFVLNRGDVGLLRSLDALSAEAASQSTNGGATIAAHADHLRYGISLMNRWNEGENPWDEADWSQSWRRVGVSDAEWRTLRLALAAEARRFLAVLGKPREVDETGTKNLIGIVVHLAYHLGAIRQIDRDARGPRAG